METKEVRTSVGKFILKKPKAGVRNRAMMAAESDIGQIKTTKFMFLLLPKCVHQRPEDMDSDVPIEAVLDDLESEDYDLLIEGLDELSTENLAEKEQKKTKSLDSPKTEPSQEVSNS